MPAAIQHVEMQSIEWEKDQFNTSHMYEKSWEGKL